MKNIKVNAENTGSPIELSKLSERRYFMYEDELYYKPSVHSEVAGNLADGVLAIMVTQSSDFDVELFYSDALVTPVECKIKATIK